MAKKIHYTENIDKQNKSYCFFKIEEEGDKLTTIFIKEASNATHFTYMVDRKNKEAENDLGYTFIIESALRSNDSTESRFNHALKGLKTKINSIK